MCSKVPVSCSSPRRSSCTSIMSHRINTRVRNCNSQYDFGFQSRRQLWNSHVSIFYINIPNKYLSQSTIKLAITNTSSKPPSSSSSNIPTLTSGTSNDATTVQSNFSNNLAAGSVVAGVISCVVAVWMFISYCKKHSCGKPRRSIGRRSTSSR